MSGMVNISRLLKLVLLCVRQMGLGLHKTGGMFSLLLSIVKYSFMTMRADWALYSDLRLYKQLYNILK